MNPTTHKPGAGDPAPGFSILCQYRPPRPCARKRQTYPRIDTHETIVAERCATLHVGKASLDIYPGCDAEQLRLLVEFLRLC